MMNQATLPKRFKAVQSFTLNHVVNNRSFGSNHPSCSRGTSRSKYASHLRKAFLLRVHPDRFRMHSETVRKKQADIVQAIGARMESTDFKNYASGYNHDYHMTNNILYESSQKTQRNKEYEFFLQKKDGTLMKKTLNLNASVENVLQNMVSTLASVGGVALPPPPSSSSSPDIMDQLRQNVFQTQTIRWPFASSSSEPLSSSTNKNPNNDIHHRIHHRITSKHKARDLFHFLKNIHHKDILRHKSNRIDAHAAALVARRAFQFQAIDGTRIGWSSESMAKLLSSLKLFHSEHVSKFHVTSFYPMYLEMSCDESEDKICLFGGRILLNPSATPIQWLHTFMKVTQDSLRTVKQNQQMLIQNTKIIQERLGLRFKKGQSCQARAYHECIHHLAKVLQSSSITIPSLLINNNNNDYYDVTLQRLQVIIESDFACRRGIVTNEGHIRIGAKMTPSEIIMCISNLSEQAYEQRKMEYDWTEKCNELKELIQIKYGLHDIYRVRVSTVKSEEMYDCLVRLLSKLEMLPNNCDDNPYQKDGHDHDTSTCTFTAKDIFTLLAGHSLGITSKGQFCHLGDDGSIIIPSDI